MHIYAWMGRAAALAVILAVPAAAAAGSSQPEAAGMLFVERFDRSGDGRVSLLEFPGPVDHFARMDADGDGYIDVWEAGSVPPAEGPRVAPPAPYGRDFFADCDVDDDGFLSMDEFAGSVDRFRRLDADGDGHVSLAEWIRHGPQPRKALHHGSGPADPRSYIGPRVNDSDPGRQE